MLQSQMGAAAGLFAAHVVFEGASVPPIRRGADDLRPTTRPTGPQPHFAAHLCCKGRRKLINAMYDSGAGATLMSLGAVRALGWEDIMVAADGMYSSASGASNPYLGLLEEVQISIHPNLCFQLERVRVTGSPRFWVLIGCDLCHPSHPVVPF